MFGDRLIFFWIDNKLAEAMVLMPDTRYRGGMTKKNDAIERTPAENNPWYNFMQKSIKLDGEEFPRGHHWFWSLHSLHESVTKFPKINLKALQNKLPDEHWLKKIETDETNWIPDGELGKISTKAVQTDELCALHDYLNEIECPKDIDFSWVEFNDDTDFSNFIFPLDTDFRDTQFSKDILFSDAVFLEAVNFKNAQFNGERAKFKNTTFKKIADFSDTIFQHYANFKGSVFNGRTTFQRAKFILHTLRFYGVDLNNEIIWTGIERPTLWKNEDDRIDESGEWLSYQDGHAKYKKRVGENQNAYETLAYLMDKQEKYHDQHFFFRHEMRCRRNLEWFFIKPFYWLYQIFANYGYGVGLAFFWWLLNIGIGFYMLLRINHHAHSIVDSPIRCSILTSFANAHSFLFLHNGPLKGCYGTFKGLPEFSFVWGFQTIAGVPLLFLLLLTLRIRFRIK